MHTPPPERTELVVGCPGAGKTTYLLDQIEQELDAGTPPERIAFLTFTRRARQEAVERTRARFDLTDDALAWFRTLHSMAYRQLALRPENILGRRHRAELQDYLGLAVSSLAGMDGDTGGGPGDRMLHHDTMARLTDTPLAEHYAEHCGGENFSWWELERLSRGLRTFKQAHGLMDHTDILREWLLGGPAPEIDVLFVDEAQDLSRLQWAVITRLADNARRVVVAGDDDQAIFSWAGADVPTFVGLRAHKITVLDQSHRVPRAVQGIAAGIARDLRLRREKTWLPRQEDGAVERIADLSHAPLDRDDWLILARHNYQLTAAEEILRRGGYAYERSGTGHDDARLIELIRAWERLRSGGSVPVGRAAEIYAHMSSGVGYRRGGKADLERDAEADDDSTVSMDGLRASYGLLTGAIWHEALDRVALQQREFLIAALRNRENLSRPRIRLSTIHRAKGAEATNVAMLTDISTRAWQTLTSDPDCEMRVAYVGVTRAKSALYLVAPRTQRHYGF